MNGFSFRPVFRRFAILSFLPLATLCLLGAGGYRTENFTVSAPTPQLAMEFGLCAENCRRQLAMDWLGQELPRWEQPCPISARCSPELGAGGATSFIFDKGLVFGWDMKVQGSRERIIDSVIPHEVLHTVFASHFRQPLPRWADEGACTTVEHQSEIGKQERMLMDFLRVSPGHPGRGIPFNDMFAMKEYPADVLPLYAQGHSLTQFLIYQGGRRKFMVFLTDGLSDENWARALRDNYQYQHLLAVQMKWLDWVKLGRPSNIENPGFFRSLGTRLRGEPPPTVIASVPQGFAVNPNCPDGRCPLMQTQPLLGVAPPTVRVVPPTAAVPRVATPIVVPPVAAPPVAVAAGGFQRCSAPNGAWNNCGNYLMSDGWVFNPRADTYGLYGRSPYGINAPYNQLPNADGGPLYGFDGSQWFSISP